ncbi:MAG: family transcriptional regulator, cyclic receptor protein [Betaproteobacteria bacterium]|nr:family transcriptional regulator, cyclic receptor protein [Betaproteobacteria bacterium]
MLRHVSPFSLLTEHEFNALTPCMKRRAYSDGASIVCAKEHPEGVYFILSGRVVVLIEDQDARAYIVGTLGRNDFFGETCLFRSGPSRISVRAKEACQILYIPRNRLLEQLQHNSRFASYVLERALTRLDEAHLKLEALALMTVHERVARILIDTAEHVKGTWLVRSGTETIAGMVGASREMVSRVLRQMIESGAVRRDKRLLFVTDPGLIAEAAATPNVRNARLDSAPAQALG